MSKPQVLEESPMNLAEVKDELIKIQKRDEELNFRSNKTLEHLQQMDIPSKTKAKELVDKITALDVPRLKDLHIQKIVSLTPRTVEDLKVILQGYTLTVKQDNQKKIVEAIKSVLG